MTDPDRLNPLLFAGCFAYLDSDVPAGMTLPAWRSQRNGSAAASSSPPVAGAGADRAPEDRTLRARLGRSGRATGAAPAKGGTSELR